MIRLMFLFILIFIAAGCATHLKDSARHIKESDNTEIRQMDCVFLAKITGGSTLNGPLAARTGVKNAKIEALHRAAEMNATHIVWDEIDHGFFEMQAIGRAYRCPEET